MNRDGGLYPRTRVKICGIVRVEDALVAAHAGADAIGLVFYESSPRSVSIGQARAILDALPAFVSRVALFVDAGEQYIRSVLEACPMDVLQFHGNEPASRCSIYDRPYIKALRVQSRDQVIEQSRQYSSACALLLDTWNRDLAGGTGQQFDWSLIPDELDKPLILAGGLNPDNVRTAILQVKPYAVDVSGGVEASRGNKDPEKIKSFINEVNNAVIRQQCSHG